MRLFIMRRIGNYHEETYGILTESEEEGKEIYDGFSEFEIEPNELSSEIVTEINLEQKGIVKINSYNE